ncbi:MAG: methyltransferase domain-containing protein [Cytophagales bacterium]|nr:methyltransferase domain-containing protein [Cytophagales bacterium]
MSNDFTSLGIAAAKNKDYELAVDFFQKAIDADFNNPKNYNNLANALSDLGLIDDAILQYKKAIELAPNYTNAHLNLATTYQTIGNTDAALESFYKVLSFDNGHIDALTNCFYIHFAKKEYVKATFFIARLIEDHPTNIGYLYNQAVTAMLLNEREVTLKHLKLILAIDPNHNPTQHLLAMHGAGEPLEVAPRKYIEDLFNGFANHFEIDLVQHLQYRIPQKIALYVNQSIDKKRSVLDLGCGTGLVGLALNGQYAKLVGVDLAKNMLEKAAEKSIYNELIQSDICDYFISHTEKFDLIVAADVLIYVGKLEAIFSAVSLALSQHGQFIFSIESSDLDDYQLTSTGRYKHSKSYIESLARQYHLVLELLQEEVIRLEGTHPVHGFLVVLRL